MTNFFVLWPMSDEPAKLDRKWLSDFLKQNSFPCGHLNYGIHPNPTVIEEFGQSVALSFFAKAGDHIIRNDLRELLSPEIDRELYFGRIEHVDEGEVKELASYWGRSRVWLRGGRKSWCQRCPTCNQVIYNPMGKKWWLLESNVPDTDVFTTHYGGVVISQKLLQRVKTKQWKKIEIVELPVFSTSQDDFPADLLTITPEQERHPPWRNGGV